MKEYFLDNASTTKPYKEVADIVYDTMLNCYGNPSSQHQFGYDAKEMVENVRDQIAKDIGCNPEEIIFTSGACEANSLAFTASKKILTTKLEHKSIETLCEYPLYFNNDNKGNIILDNSTLVSLGEHNWLVSVNAANSEIGVVQDIESISKFVHRYSNIFHIDATQLYGETPIKVNEGRIDMMSVSAQKFNGPKGIGFLYCRNGIKLMPIIGGSQETYRRGGTYNVPGIVGMGKALEITRKIQCDKDFQTASNRNELAKLLLQIPNVHLNGPELTLNRLFNNISLTVDDIKASDLVTIASMNGIYISAGSACNSGEPIPSHTLKAIGLTDEQALSTVRITVDDTLNQEDIIYIANTLKSIINMMRTN